MGFEDTFEFEIKDSIRFVNVILLMGPHECKNCEKGKKSKSPFEGLEE